MCGERAQSRPSRIDFSYVLIQLRNGTCLPNDTQLDLEKQKNQENPP